MTAILEIAITAFSATCGTLVAASVTMSVMRLTGHKSAATRIAKWLGKRTSYLRLGGDPIRHENGHRHA